MNGCSRCGSLECTDPDSKNCSDNVIRRLTAELEQVRVALRWAQEQKLELQAQNMPLLIRAESAEDKNASLVAQVAVISDKTKRLYEIANYILYECDHPAPNSWYKDTSKTNRAILREAYNEINDNPSAEAKKLLQLVEEVEEMDKAMRLCGDSYVSGELIQIEVDSIRRVLEAYRDLRGCIKCGFLPEAANKDK